MENNEKKDGMYTASFVLGLLSLLMGGLILGILGLVFSIKSKNKLKANNESNGMVTAGLILSIIGLVKSALAIILVFLGIGIAIFKGDNGIITRAHDARDSYNRNYNSSYYRNY